MLVPGVLLATNVADMWRVARMPQNVILVVLFPRKRPGKKHSKSNVHLITSTLSLLVTNLTLELLIGHVLFLVILLVLLPCKRFLAVLTLKRCLARMDALMVDQVLSAGKRFVAQLTVEGLVGRMAFHVALQRCIVGEHVKTDVAHKHGAL